jgi:putative DNA primase/helicase
MRESLQRLVAAGAATRMGMTPDAATENSNEAAAPNPAPADFAHTATHGDAERAHTCNGAADTPDPHAAVRDVLALYHDLAKEAGLNGVFVLAFIDPRTGTLRTQKFGIGNVSGMADAAVTRGEHANVYFAPVLLRKNLPPHARGKREDIVAVLGLVLDDDRDTDERALLPFGIEPTFTLTTSVVPIPNFQHQFAFTRAVPPTEADALARLLFRKCGGDSGAKDIAHPWRLPDTRNFPNAQKLNRGRPPEPQAVELTGGSFEPVDPEHLQRTLEAMPDMQSRTTKGNGDARADHGGSMDRDRIVAGLPPWLQQFIDQPTGTQGDRSTHCHHVMQALMEHGLSDEQVYVVADGASFACKFTERGDLRAEITRQRANWQNSGAKSAKSSYSGPSGEGVQADGIVYRAANTIKPVNVSWVWPGRIPRGKLSLLGGDPDEGKTLLALNMAATVSKGGEWPDSTPAERGNVIILSAEDDAADTIVPRLMAAGADLSRCHIIEAVRETVAQQGQVQRLFSLSQDLKKLEQLIAEIGGASLMVVDVIDSYIGSTDSHKNAAVRGVLAPLKDLAAQHGLGILGLTHFSKQGQAKAVLRFTGSVAFVGQARAAWIATPERDAAGEPTGRKLFLKAKNNLAPDIGGLAYRIEAATAGDINTARIVWDGPVDVTADEALAPHEDGGRLGDAIRFVRDYLSTDWKSSDDLTKAAGRAGIAERTLVRARKKLKVQAVKSKTGEWLCALPGVAPSEEGA